MHREGHYGVTLLLAAPLVLLLNFGVAIAATGLMLFVTPLPDKDHKLQTWSENSYLIKILPGIISRRVKAAFRHRGIFHTFFFAFLFAIIVGGFVGTATNAIFQGSQIGIGIFDDVYVSSAELSGGVMFLIAYAWIGHIYADTLTVGSGRFGVKPYWPVSKKQVRFGYFKAANKWANSGFLAAGLLAFSSACYYKVFYLGAVSLGI